MTAVIHFQLQKGSRFEPKAQSKETCLMFNLISSLISWALFIGVCGGLVDTTIALRHEAAHAHRIGLVSLVQLNRSLLGGVPKGRSR